MPYSGQMDPVLHFRVSQRPLTLYYHSESSTKKQGDGAMIRSDQLPRFLWRLARNSICGFPLGKKILFPSSRLAAQFGPGDGAYGWTVFCAHFERLRKAGFPGAAGILEVGPERNIGTSCFGIRWQWMTEAQK